MIVLFWAPVEHCLKLVSGWLHLAVQSCLIDLYLAILACSSVFIGSKASRSCLPKQSPSWHQVQSTSFELDRPISSFQRSYSQSSVASGSLSFRSR